MTELWLLCVLIRYLDLLRVQVYMIYSQGAEIQLHNTNMNEVFCLCPLVAMQLHNRVLCPLSLENFWKLKGRRRELLKHLHVRVGNRLRKPIRYNSRFLNSIFSCLNSWRKMYAQLLQEAIRDAISHQLQVKSQKQVAQKAHLQRYIQTLTQITVKKNPDAQFRNMNNYILL